MLLASLAVGCTVHDKPFKGSDFDRFYQAQAQTVVYADPSAAPQDTRDPYSLPAPVSLSLEEMPPYWDVTLEEAVHMAISNASVLRELGGTILKNPQATQSARSPGLVETDPRFGVQAALSAYDAQFTSRGNFQNNDRVFNNVFQGGGTNQFTQDYATWVTEISKRTATGSTFAFRNNTDYDANNAPGNLFSSAWNTNLEAQFRQPLLQGYGADYNRIAGAYGVPGLYNGVVLARVNTEIEMTEFEIGFRDLLSNVENAYWDLYFAYRDLQVKIQARNDALYVLNYVKTHGERSGLGAGREAEAEEQYWRFEQEVENALNGRLIDGTRASNGSTGGTVRGVPGVYVAERRMRLLLGLPTTDGRLLRPVDEPITADIEMDWQHLLTEAMSRREELRKQRRIVQRHEFELTATRNLLKPQLDVIGLYRWRGFGHDLIELGNDPQFGNAVNNLTSGNYQEWQLGMELSLPIGFRRAQNAVRHYEIQLAQDRAVLKEQEQQIAHDLSNALAEKDRAYRSVQSTFNRRRAALLQVEALRARFDTGRATVDEILDAQRRLADAESAHFLARVEYTVAIKNIQVEKGSLFDYNSVTLMDGTHSQSMFDEESRVSLRDLPPQGGMTAPPAPAAELSE
ncbi:MAG: TolC family protein [Planctomycetaceae bacterium]|nr:TolC family protein [Planctomycetaceae bacterium]